MGNSHFHGILRRGNETPRDIRHPPELVGWEGEIKALREMIDGYHGNDIYAGTGKTKLLVKSRVKFLRERPGLYR